MKKIEVDVDDKLFRIECENCSKTFIKSFDELMVLGIVRCPDCGHGHLLMSVKDRRNDIDSNP